MSMPALDPFGFLKATMDAGNNRRDWTLFREAMLPDSGGDIGGWTLAISSFRIPTDNNGDPSPFPIPIFAFPARVWRAIRATVVPLQPANWLGPFPTFGEAILGSALAAGLSPRPSLTDAFGGSQLVLKFVPIGNSQAYSAMMGVALLETAAATENGPFDPGANSPTTLADALTVLMSLFNLPVSFLTATADTELLSRPVSLNLVMTTVVGALDALAYAVGAAWDWWPDPASPGDKIVAHLRPRPAPAPAPPGPRRYAVPANRAARGAGVHARRHQGR